MTKIELRVGDVVETKTNARYQATQQSLNNLKGVVREIEDKNNILVILPKFRSILPFSEEELIKIA